MTEPIIEHVCVCKKNDFLEANVIGSTKRSYTVHHCWNQKSNRKKWYCTCPDFQFRKHNCKHIWAVKTYEKTLKIEALQGKHYGVCHNCGNEIIWVDVKIGV